MQSETLQLAVVVFGAIDPYKGDAYMPSPRRLAATLLLWSIFGFLAGSSRVSSEAVARLGWVVVSATLVLGPSGLKLLKLLQSIASSLSTQGVTQ